MWELMWNHPFIDHPCSIAVKNVIAVLKPLRKGPPLGYEELGTYQKTETCRRWMGEVTGFRRIRGVGRVGWSGGDKE